MTLKQRNAILEAALLRIRAHVSDEDMSDKQVRGAVTAISRQAYRLAIRDSHVRR